MQQWWDEHDILNKYLTRNDRLEKRWSFIDGPITANNPMGVHHAWGRTYKDLWQRFNTMRGYTSGTRTASTARGCGSRSRSRRNSASPTSTRSRNYGIDRFVDKCKERVLRFSAVQTAQSIRLGEWMHWDDSYYTMSEENNYTIWGMLKKCWQNGWIYRGHDVMPWCPRCATGISDMEINEGRCEVSTPASTCASRWSTAPASTCSSGRRRRGRCPPTSPPPSIPS